jgi:predicted NBD/HSP70 family sugar kinase
VAQVLTSCAKNSILKSSNLSKPEGTITLAENSTRAIGGNAGRNRSHNRRVVLAFVRANEPAGRAEIARSCGLSTQAVSNITQSLVQDGLLATDGFKAGSRGKPVMRYRFNAQGAFAVGVELRPDALITAVLNLSGKRIFTNRIKLKDASPKGAVPLVRAQIDHAIDQAGQDRSHLLGAGIVMPWPFGLPQNTSSDAAELPGWNGMNARAMFEAALDCPVIVENDATAAAISERVAGIASGMDSFCFVYFGTGLGLGVITDGHALRGAFGNAGEIGHIVTRAGGISCACGNKGCLEKYASRMSLRDHLESQDIVAPDSSSLARLLERENPALDAWIGSAAENLSQVIGILENLFDPEAVILGGAMPDALLDRLISQLHLPVGSVSNRTDRAVVRVLRGASGRMTAAMGGAAMVIHQTITPAPAMYQKGTRYAADR